jgi:hypothetical protein
MKRVRVGCDISKFQSLKAIDASSARQATRSKLVSLSEVL